MLTEIVDHKQFTQLRDLESYGINVLTGEACAYGMRLLCDVNLAGHRLLGQFLGLGPSWTGLPAWNSQVNGQASVASMLLPRSLFTDLMVFILFQVHQLPYVVTPRAAERTGLWIAGYRELPELDEDHFQVRRNWAIGQDQVIDGRNVHQMTGRVT